MIKNAISLIIKNDDGKVLFSFRPYSKKVYPCMWSIPSANIKEGETHEDTIKRIGVEKLGVELIPGKLLIDESNDSIHMYDYEATIREGLPKIVSDDYIKFEWTNPIKKLDGMNESDMGMCTGLFKKYLSK